MLITVYTPKNKLFDSIKAKAVLLPSVNGEMQVLDNHIPVIISLQKGEIIIDPFEGERIILKLTEGYAQFIQNSMTIVIVNSLLSEEEIEMLEKKARTMRTKDIRHEEGISEEEFEHRKESEHNF